VFSQLSSGVRYILELLFAIVSQMGEAGAYCIVSKPDVLEGVFLIDDYGNCLDKWWKSRLTRELKDTFKNVKFVVAYSGLGKAGDVICMM
jgi:hypothetical protein